MPHVDPLDAAMIGRRAFTLALVSGLGSLGLQGCAHAAAPPCSIDTSLSDARAPLTIDTHAHIFNGSDLQIREFLSKTSVDADSELSQLLRAIGTLPQLLAWHNAPSAQSEHARLDELQARIAQCDQGVMAAALPAFRQGYEIGRAQLQAAVRSTADADADVGAAVLGPGDEPSDMVRTIIQLPADFEQFNEQMQQSSGILATRPTFAGYVKFLLHQFNHRHVNALDYLNTYSRGSTRKIDLAAASLVDYDWWLALGQPTPTSLDDQIGLMSRISVLVGGRLHGFAPFCPFREAVTRNGQAEGDAMRRVRRAIESEGFIGVKLYPPMGYAAWGNAERNIWKSAPWLPPQAREPGFGRQLDASMQSLFTYCVNNDVPVMAHTAHSNGPSDAFKALAGSEGWQAALQRFPGLAISFGHFGDSNPDDSITQTRSRAFMALMTSGADSSGRHAYADSGFFAGTLLNQMDMRDALRQLYDAPPGLLRERLMYGSDWEMLLSQKNAEGYLRDFMQVMRLLDEPGSATPSVRGASLADAFFGRNAADYLGLARNRGNRRRLEAFYARHAVPSPDWVRKVDAL